MRRYLAFLAGVLLFGPVYGQKRQLDSLINIPSIGMSYSFQFPGLDLATRYGLHSNTGVSFFVKTKRNWLLGVEWNYLFGNQIRESDMLDSIRIPNGNIIDRNGEYAIIRLYQRGQVAQLKVGKLFQTGWPNVNSGVFMMASAGFVRHKIRIDEVGRRTPQLNPDYKKGYDRLTGGLNTQLSIGYLFYSSYRLANFFFALDLNYAVTRSMRSWQYDLNRPDDAQRQEFSAGPRVGLVIPLYRKTPNEFYFD